MSRARSVAASALATLAAGVLLVPAGAYGQESPPCEPPFSPIAFAELYPAQEELPPLDADEVARGPLLPDPSFDTDGDGDADQVVDGAGDTVTITRSDGVVVLTAPGASFVRAFRVGDIDGDGRDEIQVVAAGDQRGTYLIPAPTMPGTGAVGDVGISFSPPGVGLVLVEDGSDRLVSTSVPGTSGPPRTEVRSARATLDLGPGADAGAETPSRTYDAQLVLVTDLGDTTSALVLGRQPVTEDGSVLLTVVRDDDTTVLTTDPAPLFPAQSPDFAGLALLDGPAGPHLRLVQTSRSGSAAYLWSLDDACSAPVDDDDPPDEASDVPPGATPAPPAPAIRAEATFTG